MGRSLCQNDRGCGGVRFFYSPHRLTTCAALTPERIALRAVLEWVRLCEGHVGKVTAFYVVIGEDTRRPGIIAEALGISRKTFENYRNECRVWLDGFIAGLTCEAVPSTGAAKP